MGIQATQECGIHMLVDGEEAEGLLNIVLIEVHQFNAWYESLN